MQEKWYNCETCNEFYPTSKDLNMHKLEQHTDQSSKPMEIDNDNRCHQKENRVEIKLKLKNCQFCDLAFKKPSRYHEHMRRQHALYVQINWILCSKCSLRFPTKVSVLAHQSRSHCKGKNKVLFKNKKSTFNCQLCPLKYQKIFGLIRHMRSHHKEHVEQNWIACHQCQLLYPDSKTLQSHTLRSHHLGTREDQDNHQITNEADPDYVSTSGAKAELILENTKKLLIRKTLKM